MKDNCKQLFAQCAALTRKYRYVLLLAALGLALVLVPVKKDAAAVTAQPASELADTRDALQGEIEAALSQIDGAGRVRLVLTWADAGESVYQQNTRTSGSGENASAESTVAAVPSGSSAQQALISKQLAPQCAGALIVSDGGGNAAVRLALCDAVRALTGLRADQITVVKMKST